MSDDRWRRTKALFQAAVELPAPERAAFLSSAAANDDDVRRDVESLLAGDADDATLLDRLQQAARARVDLVARAEGDADDFCVPARIGPYEIVSLLGAGAMGQVYRARDTRLHRDVALKILPAAFALDPDRVARFTREAQVLASLSHPNIAAIYGFDDSSGVAALVLELVDGPTLADRLARGPVPLGEALAIATQIAEAIEAAHEKGIVHRDLKPANIKIDGSGVVKVLDFGLAKAAIPDSGRPDLTAPHEGLILGTASYMSPEQARGQRVDKLADIWAFGCVLYELLTGRLAFPGDTVSDTIAKILEREPDWSALPAWTPAAIRRVLQRCLTKDPRQRMRDIGDARIEIESVREGPAAAARLRWSSSWLPWTALVLVVAAGGLWQARRPVQPAENPLANARFTLLTNWEGTEEGAEISPDGKFVAFLSDRDGEFDIWLNQIGTGHFTNLTREIPSLAPLGSIVRKLGFSGDAADVWFNPASRRPLLLMPLTGGAPRPFLPQGANTPAWSPDDSRLVYFYKPTDGDDPMLIADRTGGNPRELVAPQKGLHSNNPVWSPDGEWIYFVSGAEPQDETEMNVWRVRVSGGAPERLTAQHEGINFLAPLGSRTLLYVARAEDGSGPWLWALDLATRSTRLIPSGINQYTSVASSRDGRRVVATVVNPSASLWRVLLLDRIADDRDAEPYPLPAPTGLAVAPRFGGGALFYLSARGTADGLWKVEGGQASQVWRDVDGALFDPPAVALDGRRVALVVKQRGARHLWVMSADGTGRRTLAPAIDIQGAAGQSAVEWSPDGEWIVAAGQDAQGPALFKIPVNGGEPQRLIEGKFGNPVWSPDGSLIVYAGRSVVGQVDLLAIRPDGTPVKLPPLRVRPGGYRFLRDGTGLVYLPHIYARDFWRLDFATQTTRPLTRLSDNGTLRTFDVSPDGKSIVFDRSRQNANIVLIDVARE